MHPSLSTIPFHTDHSSLSRLWRISDFGACRHCRMVRTSSSSCWQSWMHCWNCVSTISVVSCFVKRESGKRTQSSLSCSPSSWSGHLESVSVFPAFLPGVWVIWKSNLERYNAHLACHLDNLHVSLKILCVCGFLWSERIL